MKTVSVSGSLRENVGKKDAKEKRKQGLVPCVMYGGEKQFHFYTHELAFRDLIYTPDSSLLKIEINGKSYDAIIQDLQFHPVTDRIIHADFLEISFDKPVKIDVPVKLEGDAPGLLQGGKLHLLLRKVRVKALPQDLPDFISVDISGMDIGDSVKVGSLQYKNLEFLNPPNSVVVIIKTTRASAIGMEPGEEEIEAAEVAEAAEAEEAAEGDEGAETAEGGETAGSEKKAEASEGQYPDKKK